MGLGLRTKLSRAKTRISEAKESLCRFFIEAKVKEKIQRDGTLGIPIIINNFNRYNAFIQLVDWFRDAGFKNITVLDNQSTYPPLLEYYRKDTQCNIVHLGRNFGHKALWDSGYYKTLRNSYFCYTDPDVLPVAECPRDLVSRLIELLWKYPGILKIGPGLRLSDIPDHYKNKEAVLLWERQFWECPVEEGVYEASLDTTFALYRPRVLHGSGKECPSLRTGEPYVFHHTPWYENQNALSDEEIFYQSTSAGVSWWSDASNLGPNKVKEKFDLKE